MLKIVITNEKGGTGKSTIACLLTEWFNYQKKKVNLIDTDPIQTSQDWVNNCLAEGRIVSTNKDPQYQVIDTAGSSGAALGWLKQANCILVPFQSHYADLKVTSDWFSSLNSKWQAKIIFIPNRWQNTKEQREGIIHLTNLIKENQSSSIITKPLVNRPAVYSAFLNGAKDNFFTNPKHPSETSELMKFINSCFNNL